MSQYLGEIRIFIRDHIPKGFLPCQGQVLFINEYPRLYMILGSQFGGDDKLRFYLPNMPLDLQENLVYCIAYEGEK